MINAHSIRSVFVLCALGLFPAGSAVADEPILLAEEARGLVVVEEQKRFEISGIYGTLSVRAGRPGEIRFMARTLDESREEIPVAIWQVGNGFTMLPAEGHEEQPILLETSVGPGVAVSLDVFDSRLTLQGIRGDVEISGAGLELNVRALTGSAEFLISESTLNLDGLEGALTLTGEGIEASARRVGGGATLSIQGGALGISELRGGVEADFENIMFRGEKLDGELRGQADGGEFRLTEMKGDGEIWLSETPLIVEKLQGKLQVDTDAAVQFTQITGDLTVRHSRFGSSIRGAGSQGNLDLEMNGGTVVLSELKGPTKLRGSDLSIDLRDLQAPVDIKTRSSTIEIEKAAGGISIENDFGSVSVRNAAENVKVVNEGGDVSIVQLKGQAEVKADGGEVVVKWSQVGTSANSRIENKDGDVHVALPEGSGCRIDAEAPYGRIEANHPDIRVTADGNFASGILGRRNQPVIEVKSGADLFLKTLGSGNPNRPPRLPRGGKRVP